MRGPYCEKDPFLFSLSSGMCTQKLIDLIMCSLTEKISVQFCYFHIVSHKNLPLLCYIQERTSSLPRLRLQRRPSYPKPDIFNVFPGIRFLRLLLPHAAFRFPQLPLLLPPNLYKFYPKTAQEYTFLLPPRHYSLL